MSFNKSIPAFSTVPQQLFEQPIKVSRAAREESNKHKAFTIWITGLPASGKTSIANALDEYFFNKKIHSFVLDGDNTRLGINSDLDFSREGRKENIRRVAQISKLMNDAGTIAIAAFITPFEEDRTMAKEIIGNENLILVYISTPIETCKQRDKKGLYQLATLGKIKEFTGISSPYEIPLHANITVDNSKNTIEHSVETIISYLEKKKLK
jgi:adenylyl-sulfate kinase